MNCLECDEAALQPGSNLVLSVDRFLPIPICRQLVEAANGAYWSRSEVESPAGAASQSDCAYNGRNSSTLMATALGPPVMRELSELERSLRNSFGIEPANLEPWQLTRYRRGETFDYHLDCGCWKDDPSGERRRTIVICLQRPLCGGSTHFRALNIMVRPRQGRLVLWNNLLPNGNRNYAMIHAARPVLQGCKIILTTWEHETRYNLE